MDRFSVIMALLKEEKRRDAAGDSRPIPIRPDHGHQILDDLNKKVTPGYSAIGRLKGLADIRGVEAALKRAFFLRRTHRRSNCSAGIEQQSRHDFSHNICLKLYYAA